MPTNWNREMTADIENLILEHLRAIRSDLAGLGERIDRVEKRMAAVEQHVIAVSIDIGNLNGRMASVESRLDRIECRLELIEA